MNRPQGHVITPHVHLSVKRTILSTEEVLFIKSGRVRVDFYTQERTYIKSRILVQGDVILLTLGGHGFFMLEPTEIIEVKQGPYIAQSDKERFPAILDSEIVF